MATYYVVLTLTPDHSSGLYKLDGYEIHRLFAGISTPDFKATPLG